MLSEYHWGPPLVALRGYIYARKLESPTNVKKPEKRSRPETGKKGSLGIVTSHVSTRGNCFRSNVRPAIKFTIILYCFVASEIPPPQKNLLSYGVFVIILVSAIRYEYHR